MSITFKKSKTETTDRYYGSYYSATFNRVFELAVNNKMDYIKMGQNIMVDYRSGDAPCYMGEEEFNYDFLFVIWELRGCKYALFGTNDMQKVEKFKAIKSINDISDKNDLGAGIEHLEGKIFPSQKDRQKMALETGMYLG